jgi:hypothetical protein
MGNFEAGTRFRRLSNGRLGSKAEVRMEQKPHQIERGRSRLRAERRRALHRGEPTPLPEGRCRRPWSDAFLAEVGIFAV